MSFSCRNVANYGSLMLDIGAERAIVECFEVVLQQSDWAILQRLAEANGAFVRGTDLLAEVWGEDMRDEHAFLRSWIHRLNDRLARCCSGTRLIDSAPGAYRLLTPDEWQSSSQRLTG